MSPTSSRSETGRPSTELVRVTAPPLTMGRTPGRPRVFPSPGRSPVRVFLVILASIVAVLVATNLPPHYPITWLIPFLFQLGSWVFVLAAIARREPGGVPRISDPGVLVLLWSALYLILPTFAWLRGWELPYSSDVTQSRALELMWLHGVYILAFGFVYLLCRGRRRTPVLQVDRQRLPRGWLLFLLPAVITLMSAFGRYLTTGNPLPQQTYGAAWFDLQSSIQSASRAGGVSFLLVQISHYGVLYLQLIQGLGAGLLLTHARAERRNRLLMLSLITVTILAMLILSRGSRSTFLVVGIVAVVFSDVFYRRFQWRHVTVLGLVALFVFAFLGYFRAVGGSDLQGRISLAYQGLSRGSAGGPLSEFEIMLGKESSSLALFTPDQQKGVSFLIAEFAAPIPSQFLPGKLHSLSTADVLSTRLLGSGAAAQGAGIAGTTIGDGLRVWGVAGVILVAAVFGAGFGLLRRWAVSPRARGAPALLALALASGVFSWSVVALRADVSNFVILIFAYVIIPWTAAKVILRRDSQVRWLGHPSAGSTRAVSQSPNEVARGSSASGLATPTLGRR
jgi:hypothetical protein